LAGRIIGWELVLAGVRATVMHELRCAPQKKIIQKKSHNITALGIK